jgi:hypothetical protein
MPLKAAPFQGGFFIAAGFYQAFISDFRLRYP